MFIGYGAIIPHRDELRVTTTEAACKVAALKIAALDVWCARFSRASMQQPR
jgi:hypothetical protein